MSVRRSAQAQAAHDAQVERIYLIALICVVIATLVFVTVGFVTRIGLESDIASATDELTVTKAELVEVQTSPDETTVETVVASNSSAKEAGEKMATLQNELLTIDLDADEAAYTANRTARMELVEATEQDSMAGLWGLELTVPATWRFATVFDFSGDSCPCVWLYEGESGELYGYATADYSVSNGKFSNVEKHMTITGYNVAKGND